MIIVCDLDMLIDNYFFQISITITNVVDHASSNGLIRSIRKVESLCYTSIILRNYDMGNVMVGCTLHSNDVVNRSTDLCCELKKQ